MERVNARLKVFWGADDGNISGGRRFFAQVGVVMVVHAAFAMLLAAAPRYEGRLGKDESRSHRQGVTGQIGRLNRLVDGQVTPIAGRCCA